MDVNETLARIRKICADMNVARYEYESAALGEDLRQAFADLDEWLSKGGFLPEDWSARAVLARRQGGV
jgi:DNA-binding HxlR family transcriptional regulator